jgi:glycosyltransferase involved in cell wall biosynthesis
MDKLLTIVIPAYNAERYIRRNLDALLLSDQEMEKLEILVVDDGGRDRTEEITKEYSNRYPSSIFFCHKENGGHGSVINYGIEHASGKYFKVVDGDDWLNHDELSDFLDLLQSHHEDLIASDYLCIEDETWKTLRKMQATGNPAKYGKSGRLSDGFADQVIKMHSLTIRTSILKQMPDRMDEHCFYVDAEYITYPIPYAESLYYDQRNLYMYRLGRNGQSMDIRSMQKNREQHLRVMKSLTDFYSRLPEIAPAKKHYIERCIAQIVENQFQIDISLGNHRDMRKKLKDWDRELLRYYPEIYHSTRKKSITLLRMTDYFALPLGYQVLRRVKKF